MDDDLIQVARTLAERGWLPGITCGVARWELYRIGRHKVYATEADLHIAAHRYITDPKRGWDLQFVNDITSITVHDWDGEQAPALFHEPYTTTLSLMRCLLRACEEYERATQQAKPTSGER